LQLVLSFQSKAPLENYGAKVFFYFGFRMFNFGFVDPGDFLAKAKLPVWTFYPLVETNGNYLHMVVNHCRPIYGAEK